MRDIYRWGNWGSVASHKQKQSWPLKSVLLDCLANAGVQAPSAHTGKGCWNVRIQLEGISLLLSHTVRVARSWAGTVSWVKVLFSPLFCLWIIICFWPKCNFYFVFFGFNVHLYPASSGELIFPSNLIFLRVCRGPRKMFRIPSQ